MSAASKPTTSWARVCYGVDDGAGCMVRAQRSGRRVSWQSVPFDRAVLAEAVAEGAAVAGAMRVGLGIAAWVAAPFASVRKAQRVFPTLLDIQLPFPLEDCLYGFSDTVQVGRGETTIPLSDGVRTADGHDPVAGAGKRVAALAFAARTEDVERRLAQLTEIGIDPHVLDYEGAALWTQALREHAVPVEGTALRVVVFMSGEEGVMVIGRGCHFWSAHRIRTGDPAVLDRFLCAQLSQLGADKQESSGPVDWFWGGKGLADGESGARLRAEAELRWPGRSVTLESPDSFLARALATRALLPGPLRTNLRCGALSHTGAKSRSENAQVRAAAVLLAAGVLLCGGAIWWESTMVARLAALEMTFQSRLERLVGYPVRAKGTNALLIAEREQAERAERRAPLADVFRGPLLTELQQALPAIREDDVRVEYLDLSFGALRIRGDAPSVAAAHALRDVVSAMGYTVDLTIADGENERTPFVLDAAHEDRHE